METSDDHSAHDSVSPGGLTAPHEQDMVEPLQAVEEGVVAAQGCRSPLLRRDPDAPATRRCPGRSACCACACVTVLAIVSALGTVGAWLTMDSDGVLGSEKAVRKMLVVGVKNGTRSKVSTADADPEPACDTSLCKVKHWDGWSQVFPFLITSTATTTTTLTETLSTTTTTTTRTLTSTTSTRTSTRTTTSTPCMVVEEGDACYKEILAVMYDIRDNPKSRDGLSMWSSFEEVQSWLHQNGNRTKCKDACECEYFIRSTSHCKSSVSFAMKTGIREHPEWYDGLAEDSSPEEFQDYLWRWVNDTECLRPCRSFPRGDPSLYCWSVARNWGYEADVIRAQLGAGAGIFSCDGFAVVSEKEWNIGWGPGGRIGEVNAVTFVGANVGVSKDGTAANTELFMRAWEAVLTQTTALEFQWTIKVDPDAVIIADRLRDHLREKTGWKVFIRNCNKLPQSPDFPMMFGSLEAISREGLEIYRDQGHRCKNELNWYSWGEDFFLGKCLPHIGVHPADDFSIISDGVCTGVNCYDNWPAAFHPFKGVNEWMNCWRAATASRGGPPPPLP